MAMDERQNVAMTWFFEMTLYFVVTVVTVVVVVAIDGILSCTWTISHFSIQNPHWKCVNPIVAVCLSFVGDFLLSVEHNQLSIFCGFPLVCYSHRKTFSTHSRSHHTIHKHNRTLICSSTKLIFFLFFFVGQTMHDENGVSSIEFFPFYSSFFSLLLSYSCVCVCVCVYAKRFFRCCCFFAFFGYVLLIYTIKTNWIYSVRDNVYTHANPKKGETEKWEREGERELEGERKNKMRERNSGEKTNWIFFSRLSIVCSVHTSTRKKETKNEIRDSSVYD